MSFLDTSDASQIGLLTRKQTRYGSTNNHMTRPKRKIRHAVSSSDTLQGIALKYGVTMEEIKRENRMWTADSLFLRPYLDIPVPADESPMPPNGHLLDDEPRPGDRLKKENGASVESVGGSEEESIRDFLGRIDTSIERSKHQIKELERNIGYPADTTLLNRAHSSASGYYAAADNANAQLSVVVRPHKQMRRHEREHEQLFEL